MRTFLRSWLTVLVAGLMAAGLAGSVSAQSSDKERTLHEYFNPWEVDLSPGEGERAAPSDSDDQGDGDDDAASSTSDVGFAQGQPPGLSVDPADDEAILGSQGPVDPGNASEPYGPLSPGGEMSRLDNRTDRVKEPGYFASFEPSVVPYKRTVVQDVVRADSGDYTFTIDSSQTEEVPVEGGEPRADEEVFWGSFLVRAEAGKLHPIPSVAPTQRILEIQAEPDASLSVERDGADNYFLRPEREGLTRVNVRIAAPASYFGGRFESDPGWSDFASADTPPLPEQTERLAKRVTSELGLSRAASPRETLAALVEHYRDFETRSFPDELRDEDLYAALSREQIGVCRHRSLAFLVSARALGFSTRYVYNEAHAFVELYWPGMGWRRIDLGGVAEDLDPTGRSGGTTHAPAEDPLPQPPGFIDEMEQMRGEADSEGTDEGDAEADDDANQTPGGGAGDEGEDGAASQASGESSETDSDGAVEGHAGDDDPLEQAAEEPGDSESAQTGEAVGESQGDDAPGLAEGDGADEVPDESSAEMAEQSDDEASVYDASGQGDQSGPSDQAGGEGDDNAQRRGVTIDLRARDVEVFRGNEIELSGSLVDRGGHPLDAREVEVYLGRVGGTETRSAIGLGSLETDHNGRFEGAVDIPSDISLGRWSLFVYFPGDDTYREARSD